MSSKRSVTSSPARSAQVGITGVVGLVGLVEPSMGAFLSLPAGVLIGQRLGKAVIGVVGEIGVGQQWEPGGPGRVAVVGVGAQTLVELGVLGDLVPVQAHPQSGLGGHGHAPLAVGALAALDDVVGEVVVVRVGGEDQVGQYGTQVQHGGQLDAQFTGGVHGDAKAEGLADVACFYAASDAAPEGGVQQDHVHRRVEHVGGQLLGARHHGVGGQRDAGVLPNPAHAR